MADWPLLRNSLCTADDTAFSSYKATVESANRKKCAQVGALTATL